MTKKILLITALCCLFITCYGQANRPLPTHHNSSIYGGTSYFTNKPFEATSPKYAEIEISYESGLDKVELSIIDNGGTFYKPVAALLKEEYNWMDATFTFANGKQITDRCCIESSDFIDGDKIIIDFIEFVKKRQETSEELKMALLSSNITKITIAGNSVTFNSFPSAATIKKMRRDAGKAEYKSR